MITLNINNKDDNKPLIDSSSFNINENIKQVGAVQASDADGDPIVKYQIVNGPNTFNGAKLDNDKFEINSVTGILSFKDSFIPDIEGNASSSQSPSTYYVRVGAFSGDRQAPASKVLIVTINDLNDEAPIFTSDSTFTIDENTTAVTTLVTTDADTNPTVTYSITGGADASSFALTNDGVLTISGTDYESGKTSYELIVTAN